MSNADSDSTDLSDKYQRAHQRALILVVERNPVVQRLERYFLDEPDLVFLDLTMTGMYGIDVLKKLREMDPKACVIVASADIQSSTLEMVKAGGASDFINKPFASDKVLSVVSKALQECADGTE